MSTYIDETDKIRGLYDHKVIVKDDKSALLLAWKLLKDKARYEGACNECCKYSHDDNCSIGNLMKWIEHKYPAEFC